MLSKEQKRSKYALERLEKLDKIDKDLANFIVGTPTMILQNGFGQTMAFLLSKGNGKDKNEKHNFVFHTIVGWSNRAFDGSLEIKTDKNGFLNSISELDQSDYITLQEETLKLLQWLKRYARAFQEDKEEQ